MKADVQMQTDVTDVFRLSRSPARHFITHAVVTRDQAFSARVSSNAANFLISAATVRVLKDCAS
jgi:hypothetical protein